MPLDKSAREQAYKTIDAFFQLYVDPYTWIEAKPAYAGYTPVCAYIVVQPDVQGLHRAAAVADLRKSNAKQSFQDYLVNTSISSWPYKEDAFAMMGEEGILSLANVAVAAGCHGSFATDITKDQYGTSRWFKIDGIQTIMASCADYEPGHNERQTYLNFLLGSKSPWKALLDCGYSCHYYKDGRLAAVSFVVEDIPEELRWSVKNFFVALRQAREHPAFADAFHEAVQLGADPRVAMLACRDVAKVSNSNDYAVNSMTYHNGGHWPLSIDGDNGLVVRRFFTGDMNIDLMRTGTKSLYEYSANKYYHHVNACFGTVDQTEDKLSPGTWMTALEQGCETKSATAFSNRKMAIYKDLKKLCDVAEKVLVQHGAVL